MRKINMNIIFLFLSTAICYFFIFVSLKNKKVIAKICSSLQVQLITELALYWIITNHPATKPPTPTAAPRMMLGQSE